MAKSFFGPKSKLFITISDCKTKVFHIMRNALISKELFSAFFEITFFKKLEGQHDQNKYDRSDSKRK